MTTTILEPQQGSTLRGVGLDTSRRSVNPEAWKRAIGTNSRATARFDVLADTKPRWDVFGASAIAQLVLLAFLLSLPLFFPERLKTALNYDVMPISNPITMVPEAPPPPPPPKIKPKVVQPKPEIKPAPEPPKVAKIIAPKPVQPPVPAKPTMQPPAPAPKPQQTPNTPAVAARPAPLPNAAPRLAPKQPSWLPSYGAQ